MGGKPLRPASCPPRPMPYGLDAWVVPPSPGLRSGFGTQCLSTKVTDPAVTFGTSIRGADNKQYLSRELAVVTPGNNSVGPIYNVESSIGTQQNSFHETAARIGFGKVARMPKPPTARIPGPGAYRVKSASLEPQFDSRRPNSSRVAFSLAPRDASQKVYSGAETEADMLGKCSPGPGNYSSPPSVGKQLLSRYETAPAVGMGCGKRFHSAALEHAKQVPGAGAYGSSLAASAVGPQALSKRQTLPKFSFGKTTRDQLRKVYVSRRHDKSGFNSETPGPYTATPRTSLGRQLFSTKETAPSPSFSRSKRLQSYGSDTPGPATYRA